MALTLVIVGVQISDALWLSLIVFLQGLSGGYIWSQIRRARVIGILELIGMGLVLGTVLGLLAGVVMRPWIDSRWDPLAPVAITLVIYTLRSRRNWTRPVRNGYWRDWAPGLAGLLAGISLLVLNLQRYPLDFMRSDGVWDQYHPDMIFFEALSNSAARYGGSDSIFMVGADIRYHWFTYAWVGQLTEMVDAEPFAVLTRVLPLVALIATVALGLVWTRALLQSANISQARFASLVPWLTVGLLVTGGYVGAINGTILNFDSPSQAMGTAWLMGSVFVLMIFLGSHNPLKAQNSILLLSVLGILIAATTGAKVSTGALIVGAVGGATLLSFLLRLSWRKRALVALLISAGAFLLIYFWVIAGSASPGDLKLFVWDSRASTIQGLNSSPGPKGALLGTFGLLLAIGARWLGGTWLTTERSWRSRPETLFGIGLVAAGIVPILVFSQGLNEIWFALAASAPLSVLSAFGLWLGWNSLQLGNRAGIYAVVISVLSILIVSYIWTDQVWENGLGRFWGPWFAYLIALVAGLGLAVFSTSHRIARIFVVATAILILQASVARSIPIIGALMGGARDGASFNASELADINVREDESVITVNELAVGNDKNPEFQLQIDPEATTVWSWSGNEIEAARYLHAHSNSGDVIVTNENEGFVIPALTRMSSYITGTTYQSVYGGISTVGEIPDRIELSSDFISQPTVDTIEVLCPLGVRWAWINKSLTQNSNLVDLGEVMVDNSSVSLIRIDLC